MSKKVRASIPPEPIRLVQAERMRVVLMKGEDMVVRCDGFVFELCLSAVVQRYLVGSMARVTSRLTQVLMLLYMADAPFRHEGVLTARVLRYLSRFRYASSA
jgi:hypothetical protein